MGDVIAAPSSRSCGVRRAVQILSPTHGLQGRRTPRAGRRDQRGEDERAGADPRRPGVQPAQGRGIAHDLAFAARPRSDREEDDYEDACNANRYLHTRAREPVQHVLRAGDDFDTVILGVPPACLPYVCGDLIREGESAAPTGGRPDPRSRWAVVKRLGNRPDGRAAALVQAVAARLGWRDLAALAESLLRSAQHLVRHGADASAGALPVGERPREVSYFCGPLPDTVAFPDPGALCAASPDDVARLRSRLRGSGRRGNRQVAPDPRPASSQRRRTERAGPPSLQLEPAARPATQKGARPVRRSISANHFEPSERCTLALPGETETRIPADDTGYANLVVTGDWIRNGVHAACFEGAVQWESAPRAPSPRPHLYPIKAERLLNTDDFSGGGAAGPSSRPADGRRLVPRAPAPVGSGDESAAVGRAAGAEQPRRRRNRACSRAAPP